MRGNNNDKLWLQFEASGCVGDYLNYRLSKVLVDKEKYDCKLNDVKNIKDNLNEFENYRDCFETTQSW